MEHSSNKAHHYNAICYLKNFLTKNKSKLFVFDRKYQKTNEKGPGAIMKEDDFYSFINLDDEIDKGFETEVLGYIDNAIGPVFEKIRSLQLNEINGDDYNIITQFVALQWLRSPKPRKEFEDYLKERNVNLSKEEIRQAWLSKAFPEVGGMIDYIGHLPAAFVLSPEENIFITSDAPCTAEFSLAHSGTQRFIPLSSRIGLLMMEGYTDKMPKISKATKEHVYMLNERVMGNSLRYVVASDKETLEANIRKSLE